MSNLTEILDNLQIELHKCASNVYEIVDPIVATTAREKLTTHLQLYATMRFIKETCEELTKMVNKNMPIVAERAEKIMTQEDMQEIKFAGLTFQPDEKQFINVTNENKEAVLQWLCDHPVGKEMVKLGYHPKTFESFIKTEFIDKGEKPHPGVSVFPQTVLNVKKSRQT